MAVTLSPGCAAGLYFVSAPIIAMDWLAPPKGMN